MPNAATQSSFWRAARLAEPTRMSVCDERHKPLSKHAPKQEAPQLPGSATHRPWIPHEEWKPAPLRPTKEAHFSAHFSTPLGGMISQNVVEQKAQLLDDALLGVSGEAPANGCWRPGGLSWQPPSWSEPADGPAQRPRSKATARASAEGPTDSVMNITSAFLQGPTAHLFLASEGTPGAG